MRLSIILDNSYFMAQINGHPAYIGEGFLNEVSQGDVIRISSAFKRDWYVNTFPIGLQDVMDDAMYQNVYTIVPYDADEFFYRISVFFPIDDRGELYGDVLPYSLAPAHISSPPGWFFLESPAEFVVPDPGLFMKRIEIWKLGERMRSVPALSNMRFKQYPRVSDYKGAFGVCGVVPEGGGYVWVYQPSPTEDDPEPVLIQKVFSDFNEVSSFVEQGYISQAFY